MQTKYLMVSVLGAFLVLAYFGPTIKTYLKTPKSGGSSSSATFVSEGPRCDNTLRTIRVTEISYPVRAGCTAQWGIADSSTSLCVYLLDAQQRKIPQAVCRGNEASFANIPITGWQSPSGEAVLIDVVYGPPILLI